MARRRSVAEGAAAVAGAAAAALAAKAGAAAKSAVSRVAHVAEGMVREGPAAGPTRRRPPRGPSPTRPRLPDEPRALVDPDATSPQPPLAVVDDGPIPGPVIGVLKRKPPREHHFLPIIFLVLAAGARMAGDRRGARATAARLVMERQARQIDALFARAAQPDGPRPGAHHRPRRPARPPAVRLPDHPHHRHERQDHDRGDDQRAAGGAGAGARVATPRRTCRTSASASASPASRSARRRCASCSSYLDPFLAAGRRPPRERLSFFEVLTAAALVHFADAPVDVGVIEVGMGGRWDATNVVDGQVAVLLHDRPRPPRARP